MLNKNRKKNFLSKDMEKDSAAPRSRSQEIKEEKQPALKKHLEELGAKMSHCKYFLSSYSLKTYLFCKIVIRSLCSSKSCKLFLFFSLCVFACVHCYWGGFCSFWILRPCFRVSFTWNNNSSFTWFSGDDSNPIICSELHQYIGKIRIYCF